MRTGPYTHEQFLDLTLREVFEVLDAASWRARQAARAALATGWHAANFVAAARGGKLKNLSEYLPDDEDGDGKPEAVELPPETEEMVWGLLLGPGRAAVH